MELKLIDGDYVPDGAGGFVRADGTEETLERLRLRLTARRGGFPFAPTLGSGLWQLTREKPGARVSAARRYIAQALADEENVTVESVELRAQGDGAALRIGLRLGGESAEMTMVTGG